MSDAPKTCKLCGVTYTPTNYRQKYCSIEHQTKAGNIARQERRVASRDPYAEATCKECGQAFVQVRANHIYCEDVCFQKAKYQRQKVERDERLFTCAWCKKDFPPFRANQAYCSRSCGDNARNARVRGTYQRVRAPRLVTTRAIKKLRSVPKQSVQQTVAPQKAFVEPRVTGGKIVPDEHGNWFPGWNGPYPPHRTQFEIELLESERGRVKLQEPHNTVNFRSRNGWKEKSA